MSSIQSFRPAIQFVRSLLHCHRYSPTSPLSRYHPNLAIVRRSIHTTAGMLQRKKEMPDDFVLRKKSSIPQNEKDFGELVYTGSIATTLRITKIISFTSSAMGISLQPVIFDKIQHLPTFLAVFFGTFCGFFIFITPLLLHLVARQYIIRLYYNPSTEEFHAVTFRFVPGMTKITSFKAEEVTIPPTPGMFTSFTVRQDGRVKGLFVNPPDFLDQQAYIKLMGYDQPMDVIRRDEDKEKN